MRILDCYWCNGTGLDECTITGKCTECFGTGDAYLDDDDAILDSEEDSDG